MIRPLDISLCLPGKPDTFLKYLCYVMTVATRSNMALVRSYQSRPFSLSLMVEDKSHETWDDRRMRHADRETV